MLAVNVTVCAVLTEVAVAVKLALLDPAGIATAAGTVTAAALLARSTLKPPLGAAPLMATVHASLAGPVSELLAQLNELSVGKIAMVPVPLRPIAIVPPPVALLARDKTPVTAPTAVGVNCTVIAID
jgi:hypothetical protein